MPCSQDSGLNSEFWLTYKAVYVRLLRMNLDPSLLRAALIGYENQLAEIEKAMAELRSKLKGTSPAKSAAGRPRTKRTMSAAARRRIAEAQKKRWAAYRKAKATK